MNLQKTSKITLLFLLFFTVFFGYQLQYLQFSYDMEDFFPINSEDTQFFEKFCQNFGNDGDYILIGVHQSKGIFQQDFLEQIEAVTEQIKRLPNIENVQSITHLKEFRRSAFYHKLLEVPYITTSKSEKYAEDSSRIYNNPLLVDFLVSKDAKSVLLYAKNTELLDEKGCRELTADLHATLEGFTFEEIHIAGRCMGQTVYIDMIQSEVQVFISFSILVIVLVLCLTYRSILGVLLPLSVVGLTVLWTMGIMVLMGKSVDLISNVIPTILMIIGIADVIHLLTHYQHLQVENQIQNNPQNFLSILKKTIKEVGKATLLTTFTTAIGFLTLTTSSFKPLVDLGWYTTIGLLLALLLTYTLVPAVLVLIEGKWKIQAQKSNTNSKRGSYFYWKKNLKFRDTLYLQKTFDWTLKHPKSIMVSAAVIIFLAVFGASQIKVNNYILEDLKEDHFQQKDFIFFEKHFGGARAFELVVTAKDTSIQIFDFEALKEIALVDSFLTKHYGVKNLVSPVVLVKSANQIYNQGRSEFYQLPSTPKENRQITKRLQQYTDDIQLEKMVDSSQIMAHISG
ncbi:MAG: efflux RND transporter permease subunit, partial [Chitinophagales bacterium]